MSCMLRMLADSPREMQHQCGVSGPHHPTCEISSTMAPAKVSTAVNPSATIKQMRIEGLTKHGQQILLGCCVSEGAVHDHRRR